jgi:hypothetical protein
VSTSLVTRALRGEQEGAALGATTRAFASDLEAAENLAPAEALLAREHSHIRLRWMPGESPNSMLVCFWIFLIGLVEMNASHQLSSIAYVVMMFTLTSSCALPFLIACEVVLGDL